MIGLVVALLLALALVGLLLRWHWQDAQTISRLRARDEASRRVAPPNHRS